MESDEPPALVVKVPTENPVQDTTVKTEEKESEPPCNPDPPAAADVNSIKIAKKRKRKRQHSTKTPLVSDGELNKSDDIEDIHSADQSNLQVRRKRIDSFDHLI